MGPWGEDNHNHPLCCTPTEAGPNNSRKTAPFGLSGNGIQDVVPKWYASVRTWCGHEAVSWHSRPPVRWVRRSIHCYRVVHGPLLPGPVLPNNSADESNKKSKVGKQQKNPSVCESIRNRIRQYSWGWTVCNPLKFQRPDTNNSIARAVLSVRKWCCRGAAIWWWCLPIDRFLNGVSEGGPSRNLYTLSRKALD